jgi:uncharacterized protein YeeX (DUF496 family)
MSENNENNAGEAINDKSKDKESKNKESKGKKPTLINIFKMKRIPIIPAHGEIGISIPTGFNIKALKKKLGIKNTNSMEDAAGNQLVSVAGETISFVVTGLEDLESTLVDISGFKALYVPEDFSEKKTEKLIGTYKLVFPFSKLGKPVEAFLPPCNDQMLTDLKLTEPLIVSLKFRLDKLRATIVDQRSLPSDSVDLRSQISHFHLLSELIESMEINATENKCSGEKEEVEPIEEDDLTRLLQKFALLLLLRKRDPATDLKNIVKQLDEEYPIKLDDYDKEPELKKSVREFIYKTLKKTPVSGGSMGDTIEDKISKIDDSMKSLSDSIQGLEIKDTPTKKEARELVKKQKELNSLSKKRVALEEELYEMENSASYTVKTAELPPLVDAVYPELQNSKFLKFEKELNEKLNN